MALRRVIQHYAYKSLDSTFDRLGTAVYNTPKLAEHMLFLPHQFRVITHEEMN
jgi:hypothetical protein